MKTSPSIGSLRRLPTPGRLTSSRRSGSWSGTLFATAVLLSALWGCGDGDTAAAAAPIVQDSAGIRIVVNPGAGAWAPSEAWRVEEEVRIGVDSGEEELQFASVAGIDADDDGRIYVLDAQARRIRVFDPEGNLLNAFGRAGGGPGELSQAIAPPPGGLMRDASGALVVPDLGNQRLARFSADGETLESPRLGLESGIPLMWTRSDDGTIHYQLRRMDMGTVPAAGANPTDEILRLPTASAEGEAVLSFPSGETFTMGAGGMPTIRIFAPETMWTVLDDGRFVTGSNDEYSLTFWDAEGDVAGIVRREVRRRPVTDGDMNAMRGVFERAWEEAGMPAEVIGQLLGTVEFESYWPALSQLLAGPEGTLWVQRVDPESATGELTLDDLQAGRFGSPAWDVFDAEGTYMGAVEMPEGVSPLRFVDDRLYGVHRDDFEVQRVVRLRLVRGD